MHTGTVSTHLHTPGLRDALPKCLLTGDSGISRSTTTRYFCPRTSREPRTESNTGMMALGLLHMPGSLPHDLPGIYF